MSTEMDRWTELAQDQTAFFSAQLGALNQAVFSPAAHQAGIIPLNATRCTMQINSGGRRQEELPSILWPDPYQGNAYCVAIATPGHRGLGKAAFVRVSGTDESFHVEGVALNLNALGGNVYGKQDIPRKNEQSEPSAARLGGNFLLQAEEEAKRLTKERKDLTINMQTLGSPILSRTVDIAGIEGDIAARLFRSLSSFGSNLVINGAHTEHITYTDQTFDLTQALLKMTINDFIQRRRTGNPGADTPARSDGLIISPETKQPVGAVFETSQGLALIKRLPDIYPQTIELTVASRSPLEGSMLDGSVFVNYHYISAKGAVVDSKILSPDVYNAEALVGLAAEKTSVIKHMMTQLPQISADGTRLLEQALLGMISERASLPNKR